VDWPASGTIASRIQNTQRKEQVTSRWNSIVFHQNKGLSREGTGYIAVLSFQQNRKIEKIENIAVFQGRNR
jgi:hypothetical protein